MSDGTARMTGSTPKRRILLGAVALVAAAIVIGLLLPSFGARRGPRKPTTAATLRVTPAHLPRRLNRLRPVLGTGHRRRERSGSGDEARTDSEPKLPTVVSLARKAAESYRQRAEYPPWSHPLSDGEDPILRDREVSPVVAAGPDGAEPVLTVFPDQVSFETPEPAILHAYLSRGGERVPAAEIRGTVMTEALEPLAEITYRDDGREGDPVAGDNLYTARFQLDADTRPALSESFMVQVHATTTDGDERRAASGFLYSHPAAQLTGTYKDTIADGSLAIDAQIEVLAPGRFHIEGTLYSEDGHQAIAWAQDAAEFAPGLHWLRLSFYGRTLAQSGRDGPYLLRFVALSTTTQMPNAKNHLVEDAFVTRPYRSTEFSDAPFNDSDLLDAARRLEHDLAGPGLKSEG